MKKIILLSCILILLPISAFASEINVPVDQPTIQAGIDVAVDGDVVLLADDTYTGVGNYNIDLKGKSITVKSSGGAESCIIDCQQNGRGFLVYSGETVTFEGLTVKNGDAGDGNEGGGIYTNGSDVVVVCCVFVRNCASFRGGAVYSSSASLSCVNCSFTSNTVGSGYTFGGAVYSRYDSDSSSFTNCSFTSNSAGTGGAVCSASSFSFANCTFTSNSASQQGGAVSAVGSVSSPVFSFTDCIFRSNSASQKGGAVDASSFSSFVNCTFTSNNAGSGNSFGGAVYYINNSSPSFTNCSFTSNSSVAGGAVCSESNADASSFINCIFTSNKSTFHGGAICASSSSFINCTFSLNEAADQGGAIWCDIPLAPRDPIVLKNCILWGNTAPEGSEIYEKTKPLIITYSDTQGGHTGVGNIDSNPQFLSASTADMYLHPYSPCVDSGTADGAPGDDIDGYIRPIGNGIDMGAYEYRNDIYIWEGQTSNWSAADNWNGNKIPGYTDFTIICSVNAVVDPEINTDDAVVGTLLIESSTLTVDQGKLSIGSF